MPVLPPGGKLAFTVWRQGRRIGSHEVLFEQSGDSLTVATAAHFAITFGPLTVYAYRYDATETWSGGQLAAMTAKTNNNGTHGTCVVRRDAGRLAVSGSKSGDYVAPHGSIAGTHWNMAELAAPMIDPQNGELLRYAIADRGREAPPWGGDAATHYALAGLADLDLWYNAAGHWVGLRAVAKDRSVVEYRPA